MKKRRKYGAYIIIILLILSQNLIWDLISKIKFVPNYCCNLLFPIFQAVACVFYTWISIVYTDDINKIDNATNVKTKKTVNSVVRKIYICISKITVTLIYGIKAMSKKTENGINETANEVLIVMDNIPKIAETKKTRYIVLDIALITIFLVTIMSIISFCQDNTEFVHYATSVISLISMLISGFAVCCNLKIINE